MNNCIKLFFFYFPSSEIWNVPYGFEFERLPRTWFACLRLNLETAVCGALTSIWVFSRLKFGESPSNLLNRVIFCFVAFKFDIGFACCWWRCMPLPLWIWCECHCVPITLCSSTSYSRYQLTFEQFSFLWPYKWMIPWSFKYVFRSLVGTFPVEMSSFSYLWSSLLMMWYQRHYAPKLSLALSTSSLQPNTTLWFKLFLN